MIYTEDAERIFGPLKWQSRTETILKDDKEPVDVDDTTTVTPPPFEQDNNE